MSDEQTTVSWKAIEPHWKVYSADDIEIGVVFLPVGDENTDIFDGLAITHHGGPMVTHNWLDRPRYVSYEKVASITPGVVRLTIKAAEARDLPEHDVRRDRRDPSGGRQQERPSEDRPREAHRRGQDLLRRPGGRSAGGDRQSLVSPCAPAACAARPWAATRRSA